jgi:cytochrome P450
VTAQAPDEIRLSDPSFWLTADREQAFALLRSDRPVSWHEEPETKWSKAGRGYWAVVRHGDVRYASRATELFISSQGTELFDLPVDLARSYSGMVNMDAPEHPEMRAIVNIAFSPRRIATLEQTVERRADMIIDAVCERGECDFATEIADALPIAVICDLMGVPEADRNAVSRLSRQSHPFLVGTFDDAYRAARELIEYGKELLRTRLERPGDDLTSLLAAAEIDQERLGDDEAGTFFELLVTAGIETTGAAISHGLIALGEHAEQRALWHADYDGIASTAIEEILRWSTPVVHFRRTASAETELAGQLIAAGDKVVLFYNSANRDEAVFEAPGQFDVMRANNPHVTFGGGGPHFCLGAHLARLEMRVIFGRLFERLPDLTVSGPPKLTHSMFFNGVEALPCEFTAQTTERGI